MKTFLVFLVLLGSLGAFARLSDGKVSFVVSSGKIVGSVQKGFHFNKDAPAAFVMKGAEIAPLVKEEQQLVFALPAKEREAFELGFYVCDDKKTVCEEHKMSFVVDSGKLKPATEVAAKVVSNKEPVTKMSGKAVKNHHGFIVNDLEAAKSLAKKTKKNILVDYGAPWCPACVRLETEVFGTKQFKGATKDLILAYLNADLTENKSFGKQYEIKAIPTVLLLNSEGGELYRSLDFVPAGEFAKRLLAAKKNLKSRDELTKLAEAGDKSAMLLLAERAAASLDNETAVKWYLAAGSQSDRYALAEMNLWYSKVSADKKMEDGFVAVHKKWIESKPLSYVSVSAANDWAGYLKRDTKGLPADLKTRLAENLEFLKKLTSSRDETVKWMAGLDSYIASPAERAEALVMRMTAADLLDNKTESEAAKADLVSEMKSLNLSEKRPGEIMAVQSYFRSAGMKAEEETWLLKLQNADPNNYVPYMRLAYYYSRNKAYEKALPQAQKAVELGPDLRLYNLKHLAEIQKELKQKEDARKTIDLALADPEVKADRFKDLLRSLEDLKKSL